MFYFSRNFESKTKPLKVMMTCFPIVRFDLKMGLVPKSLNGFFRNKGTTQFINFRYHSAAFMRSHDENGIILSNQMGSDFVFSDIPSPHKQKFKCNWIIFPTSIILIPNLSTRRIFAEFLM